MSKFNLPPGMLPGDEDVDTESTEEAWEREGQKQDAAFERARDRELFPRERDPIA